MTFFSTRNFSINVGCSIYAYLDRHRLSNESNNIDLWIDLDYNAAINTSWGGGGGWGVGEVQVPQVTKWKEASFTQHRPIKECGQELNPKTAVSRRSVI